MCGVTVEGVDMVIVRGEAGYRPIPSGLTAEEMNTYYKVTPEDRLAMVHGALVGWDTPGADPDHYRGERRHA
jgi:hypothetical protein